MDEDLKRDVVTSMRLNRAMRLLQACFFREAYASYGVSLSQYSLMAVLQEKGEPTMGQLADALGITMGAVTSLVDRLIHLGYVERERGTEDRRVVKVRLTPAGRETFQAITDHGIAFAASALGEVSPEDRRAFLRVQQKAVEKFTEATERMRQDGQ